MRSTNTHHIVIEDSISEEALLAYARGELNEAQRQQLEKLLVNDPFAQEALEGLQLSAAKTDTHITALQQQVRERSGLKTRRGGLQIHWSAYAYAAATFAVLIGIGFFLVNYIGNQKEEIAMNDERATPTEQAQENLLEEPKQEAAVLDSSSVVSFADSVSMRPANEPTTTTTITEVPTKQEAFKALVAEQKNLMTDAKDKDATGGKGGYVAPTGTGGMSAPPAGSAPAAANVDDAQFRKTNETLAKQRAVEDTERLRVENSDTKKSLKEESAAAKERKDEAKPSATTAVPVNASTLDEAMKSFNSGDYKKSSEQFNAILKAQPENTDALYFGAVSDYINGNAKKSEANFDKLLKKGAKYNEGSKWYKANILLKKGKTEEAKKLLQQLAETNGSYRLRAVQKMEEIGQ